VKWGYRCERIDLIASGEALAGVPTFKRIGSLLDTLLRPFRRSSDRATRF
jgi:hypothetical protein